MGNDFVQLESPTREQAQDIVISLDQVVDALERAYAYVDTAGSDLDRLRFAVLLEKAAPEDLLEAFGNMQSEEGFFATGSETATLESSLEVLAALDDCGLLGDARLKPWVQAVSKGQASDGMWLGETRTQKATADERLALCGMLAAFLVKSGSARIVIVDAALEAMAEAWSTERVGADFCPLLASYFHLLTLASHEIGDEALQWCGRELEKGLRGGAVSGLEVARILLFCDAYALPGVSMDGGRLIPEILREQQADGSFPTRENALGLQTPLQATLTAVLALSRFSKELQASLPEENGPAEG